MNTYTALLLLMPVLKLNKNKDKAAIIGGGDGGVARECISKGFNFIDWYELDSRGSGSLQETFRQNWE